MDAVQLDPFADGRKPGEIWVGADGQPRIKRAYYCHRNSAEEIDKSERMTFDDRSYEVLFHQGPAYIKRLFGRFSQSAHQLQQKRDLASLQGKLREILLTADAHHQNKVPPGDKRYWALWNVADAAVIRYCTQWQIDRTLVDAQIPGLQLLKQYSIAPALEGKGAMIGAGVVGLILTPFLLGLLVSLLSYVYHLGQAVILHLTR